MEPLADFLEPLEGTSGSHLGDLGGCWMHLGLSWSALGSSGNLELAFLQFYRNLKDPKVRNLSPSDVLRAFPERSAPAATQPNSHELG